MEPAAVVFALAIHYASGASHPQITPPPTFERRGSIVDPAFEGFTSDFDSWSPIFCSSGSTYKTFGTIADCCTTDGNCQPATDCFAGQVVEYADGSAVTRAANDCTTGFVYKMMGDPSPLPMFGCLDEFELYRTIDGAAMTSIDPSSPSTVDGLSPGNSSSTFSGSRIHPAIIAAAVVVVMILLVAIGGLVTWILLLKRRQKKQTSATELKPMPSRNISGFSGFETKVELPSPLSDLKPPYSTTNSPVSAIQQQYSVWQPHNPGRAAMELPAYTMRGNYQELSG